jgi:hypothetical protein
MKINISLLLIAILGLVSCVEDDGQNENGPVRNLKLKLTDIEVSDSSETQGSLEALERLDQTGDSQRIERGYAVEGEDTQVILYFSIPQDLNLSQINTIQLHSNVFLTAGQQVLAQVKNGNEYFPLATIERQSAPESASRQWRETYYKIDFVNSMSQSDQFAVVLSTKHRLDLDFVELIINSTRADTVDLPINQNWWRPQLGTPWHIQYVGDIAISDRFDIYNIDLFESSEEFISSLKARGKRVICYFSAGSYENWRPDESDFPDEVIGRRLSGWPGERWLNTRERGKLRPVMEARIKMAREKGCDGVDPDNVDGYINNTGFNLSYDDTLLYNRMIADLAHSYGLAVGLKNDVDQLEDLVDWYDFAVNEECFEYNECQEYTTFTSQGKPVYQIEYNNGTAEICSEAREIGMDSVHKNLNLDGWLDSCDF